MSDPQNTAASEEPGQFHFAQLVPMLVFDVVAPIAIYDILTARGFPVLWSLVAGGLPPAFNNLRSWFRTGRLEPLGIIIVTLLAVSAVASLVSNNVFFVLVKESFLTSAFGLICLGSLFTARPLMFVVMRQFVAGEDAARIAWWNGLYDLPQFRRGVRTVTFVFGVAYIVEALVRVVLALTLSPMAVVNISPIMAFGILILLIAWSRRHMIAIRENTERDGHAGQA